MARTVVYTLTIHLCSGTVLHTDPISSLVLEDNMPDLAIMEKLHAAMIEEFRKCMDEQRMVDVLSCNDSPGYFAINPNEVEYFNTVIREIAPTDLTLHPPAGTPADQTIGLGDVAPGADAGTLLRPEPQQP